MKSYDLTDLETAKSFARVKRADSEADTRIPKLISAMSRAIARYTRRQLIGLNDPASEDGEVDTSAVETKTFEYDGSGFLSLAPFEARSITGVTLDGVTLTEITVGEKRLGLTEYLTSPRQKTTEGTYLSLRLPRVPMHDFHGPRYETTSLVEVTGTWGIEGVPEDVELACLHAIAAEYRNPEGMPQRSFGDGMQFTDDVGDGSALPRKARELLYSFVRP